ncbi:hypothetical protein [Psychrobacter sp. I-STPA10]|uniref:hypothetical protein n=1 Tax=Psychrobacter sp. I-STPA10 TaxID=2585769 RepID=UPI001E40230C|nr:hypothetical protein [Psychrobacter sp. I-STPA10]
MDTFDIDKLDNEIGQLIAQFYTTFANYKIYDITGVCINCCLSQKNIKLIKSEPLNSLDRSIIYDYLDAVVYDENAVINEIKYLIPRIVELFNEGENIRFSVELNFDKLHLNFSDKWQSHEIELIQKFAKLNLLKTILDNDKSKFLDELLIMWHLAGLKIDCLLKIWQQAINYPKAVDDYATMLSYWFDYGEYKFLEYSDYTQPFVTEELANKMIDWAMSDEIIDIFFKQVSLAIENIDALNEWQLQTYDSVLKLKEVVKGNQSPP